MYGWIKLEWSITTGIRSGGMGKSHPELGMDRDPYKYGGARALVALHDRHMRSLMQTWKQAVAVRVVLPQTSDPDYASLDTLLRHVLHASRGYLTWLCEKLELPDPQVDPTPGTAEIEAKADDFLEHLLQKWQQPLRDIPEERFFDRTYTARWGADYGIEAMLEHAVMHPIRHEFQLRNLLEVDRSGFGPQ
jgi:hypothetical protein